MALSKKNRLKKKKDFERVFKEGETAKGSFLFARYFNNEQGFPRVAFVVSLKVSKKAVVRNRIRRILSEAAGAELKNIRPADIVIIADKKIINIPKAEVIRDLKEVLRRIK